MPAGGGYGPGMPGGNDMHVSVGAGIGVGRGYVVGEKQEGPSTVTDTYQVVGDSKPMNKTPIFVCLGIVALIGIYFFVAGMVSDVHVTATSHSWRFEVHTQIFTVVHDGDWQRNLPYDSYNRMCSLRQSGTHRSIIGQTCHNEHTTRSSQSCDTSNGVQHCQTITTPVVQRVCHNIYQYYIDYDTWCDYNANRWVHQTPAVSAGSGLAPYWPYAPITNCGMLGCTRLSHTEQHFMVDFHIDDGHSAGSTDQCDFSDPQWQMQQPQMMWGWINDHAQYQAQATNFGSALVCNSVQTPQAAPPPPDFQFVPQGGNSTDVLPQQPSHMTTQAPGPEYAPGGHFTGTVPAPAPSPPPTFLAAEEPEITELDIAELAEGEVTE